MNRDHERVRCRDCRYHHPRFCGYTKLGGEGKGLALSILTHHFHQGGDSPKLADAKALALYHDFKRKLITPLQGDWQFDTHVVADTVSMVVKEQAQCFFSQAMRLEVETKRLARDLDECYELLEPFQADQE